MIADDLILQAQASGIELRLVGGKVKAVGPREAVVRLIEPLRQHREALAHALQCELQEALPVTPPADPVDWHALDAAYLAIAPPMFTAATPSATEKPPIRPCAFS